MNYRIDPGRLSLGERVLWNYGITEPEEINMDAIAFDLGIQIRRRKLDGADARLVTVDERGVITVNTATHIARQRFSIGHEIGHWFRDRTGDGLMACSKEDVSPRNQNTKTKEAEANRFSSDLLLPPYLVMPRIVRREPCIDLVSDIADEFETSLPATAIRIVRHAPGPAAVVVHSHSKREWLFRSFTWPDNALITNEIHHDSPALDLLYSGAYGTKTRDMKEPAYRWIFGGDWRLQEVKVQSVKRYNDHILSLLRICK